MNRYLLLMLLSFLGNLLFGQKNIDSLTYEKAIDEFNFDNTLVLIGEAHEVEGTYGLETFILSDLLSKGYEHIIYEGGVSEAILLNEYLETGNEAVLDYTRARGKHYRNYMKSLFNLKLKFPSFTITGVDFERAVCLEKVFSNWFVNYNDNNEMLLDLIQITGKTKPKKVKEIILRVRASWNENVEIYREVLGSNLKLFRAIIFNPVFQADFGMSSKKRDEAIHNHLKAFDQLYLSKSVVIFGSNHFTNPDYFWSAYAPSLKDKLNCVLILLAYQNCNNLMKNGKKYSSVEPLSNFFLSNYKVETAIRFEVVKDSEISPLDTNNKFIIAKLINQ